MKEVSRQLTLAEFETKAMPQLLKLCKGINPDPMDPPFTELGLPRLILYEFWVPQGAVLLGLQKAIQALGEDYFFVSILGFDWQKPNRASYHWKIMLEDLGHFDDFIGPLDYTMYSATGSWAIVSSMEEHALMTCSNTFLATLQNTVPTVQNQVVEFLRYYKSLPEIGVTYMDTTWINAVMDHLYGRNAQKLFQKAGIDNRNIFDA